MPYHLVAYTYMLCLSRGSIPSYPAVHFDNAYGGCLALKASTLTSLLLSAATSLQAPITEPARVR